MAKRTPFWRRKPSVMPRKNPHGRPCYGSQAVVQTYQSRLFKFTRRSLGQRMGGGLRSTPHPVGRSRGFLIEHFRSTIYVLASH